MPFGKFTNTTADAVEYSPKYPIRVISSAGATIGGTALTADTIVNHTEIITVAATTGEVSYEY